MKHTSRSTNHGVMSFVNGVERGDSLQTVLLSLYPNYDIGVLGIADCLVVAIEIRLAQHSEVLAIQAVFPETFADLHGGLFEGILDTINTMMVRLERKTKPADHRRRTRKDAIRELGIRLPKRHMTAR